MSSAQRVANPPNPPGPLVAASEAGAAWADITLAA
jgi:hypothetical protein